VTTGDEVWVLEGEAGHVVGVYESLADILARFPDPEWRPECAGRGTPPVVWSNFRWGAEYLECWALPVQRASAGHSRAGKCPPAPRRRRRHCGSREH